MTIRHKSDSEVKNHTKTIKINTKQSLILLKIKALKLDLRVPRLLFQKLIKKKEVNPINSQPKNNVNKLFAKTRHNILKINQFNNKIKEFSLASYLK